MKLIKATISILFFILLSGYVYAADYYVISGGTGDKSGSDWDNALDTIQKAIDKAESTPESDTIHVAAGTYNEHLVLVSDVTLYGGYPAAGGETRDRIANPTYINGDRISRTVYLSHVSNVTIDGFVIQNGNGGIYIRNSSSSVTINGNTVTNNTTDSYGSGICVGESSTDVRITNNNIQGNSAGHNAGGIMYLISTGEISGNTISGNTTEGHGGGIMIYQCDGGVTIHNNTISGNQTTGEWSSVGAGIHVTESTCEIDGNTISNNSSTDSGGGIGINSSYCIISDNIITNNEAANHGGGISFGYTEGSSVTKNEITDNTAQLGGGIHVYDAYHSPNNPPKIGGALGDCNHIYNNADFDLYYLGCVEDGCTSETLDATYNYWNTLEGAEIAARIDTAGKGSVNFTPWTNELCDASLSVELSSFTAFGAESKVTLKWRTETETNNLGFNIYRSDTKDGKYVKVNSRLLAGAGTDATPHDYSFTDDGVVFGKTYYYYIEDVDFTGKTQKSHIIEVTVGKQNIKTHEVPKTFALLQNYPNPFNPETWIPFKLAQDTPVTISIYDTQARLIRTIALGNRNAGIYATKDRAAYWNGRDSLGDRVASGIYWYTLQAGEFRDTRKMAIVK